VSQQFTANSKGWEHICIQFGKVAILLYQALASEVWSLDRRKLSRNRSFSGYWESILKAVYSRSARAVHV
jgi:hypothetical protein